jgi:hypothetical protein
VEVRRRSKELFRSAYMLEICAAVGDADRVNLTSLVARGGVAPAGYSGPIRRLADLGLLLHDRQPGDDHRERWYRPADSQLWVAARELATKR